MSARYCSKTCQRTDWPVHKLLCGQFLLFKDAERPSELHFRAINFPVKTKKPEFIWLQFRWSELDDDDADLYSRYQDAVLEPYIGKTGVGKEFINEWLTPVPVLYNKVRDRSLREVIDVRYRDTFLIDGSVVNESIAGITSTVPGKHHDWRGPFVAYGKRGHNMNSPHARDLDVNDFRDVVDYLFIYSTDLALDMPQSIQQGNDVKVRGVKINCESDCRKYNKPKYEAVDVPLTDPVFTKYNTSDIADRIGLPIFTRRCQTEVTEDHINQDANFLHLCCDPPQPSLTWPQAISGGQMCR